MEPLFIKSHGKLIREKGTLVFVDINKNKRVFPINQIREIFIFGNVSLTSGAIKLLLSHRIPVHFYSRNGHYLGSLFPKALPGKTVIKQIEKFLDYSTRVYIAKEIIEACKHNFYEIFRRRTEDAKKFKEIIIFSANTIEEVMGKESQIFLLAYQLFDKLSPFKIVERTRRPPMNEANALLSFLNSLLYGFILTEIYKQNLLPSISYLHEPRENRPSLALDIAEIFKPIFSFRLMLRLFRLGKLKEIHFEKREGVYLNEKGKEIVLKEVNKILEKKMRVREMGKRSLRFFISWQVKKLKDFIEDKDSFLKTVKIF